MYYIIREQTKKIPTFLFIFHIFTVLFIIVPFILVLISAFSPLNKDNLAFLNTEVFESLLRSLYVSLITIVFIFILGYSFAYFTIGLKSKATKASIIAFVTSPLWSSFLVKLLGLKSFFDLVYGDVNSTRGLIYVVIGLIYINLPLSIVHFYNILSHMPKNIVHASLDLGHNSTESIFRVVIPYSKEAILSVIFLVFLPSFTTMTVADFLNHENSSKLVGQMINSYAASGVTDSLSRSRISVLSLFLIAMVFLSYLLLKGIPKLTFRLMSGFNLRAAQ